MECAARMGKGLMGKDIDEGVTKGNAMINCDYWRRNGEKWGICREIDDRKL